jgi:hypothetical protein
MSKEYTDAEITAFVAQSLKDHATKPVRTGLHDDDASECRKRIIELIGLDRPRSIVVSVSLPVIRL